MVGLAQDRMSREGLLVVCRNTSRFISPFLATVKPGGYRSADIEMEGEEGQDKKEEDEKEERREKDFRFDKNLFHSPASNRHPPSFLLLLFPLVFHS